MRINLNTTFENLQGETFKDEKDSPLPLSKILIQALSAGIDGSYDDKKKRARIAKRIYQAVKDGIEDFDLKTEDVMTIKPLIGACYPPLLVLAFDEYVEGAKAQKKLEPDTENPASE